MCVCIHLMCSVCTFNPEMHVKLGYIQFVSLSLVLSSDLIFGMYSSMPVSMWQLTSVYMFFLSVCLFLHVCCMFYIKSISDK